MKYKRKKYIENKWGGLINNNKCWLDESWEEIIGWDVPWGDDRWEDYLPQEGLEFIGDLIKYKEEQKIHECFEVIEKYFEGVVAIPHPQKTKESLISHIYTEIYKK